MDNRESTYFFFGTFFFFVERHRQGPKRIRGNKRHRSKWSCLHMSVVFLPPRGAGRRCMPGAWPYRTLAKTQVSRIELKRIEFLAGNDARNAGHDRGRGTSPHSPLTRRTPRILYTGGNLLFFFKYFYYIHFRILKIFITV